MKSIQNKVVIITGASSGIGKTTANFLANKGARVYGIGLKDLSGTKFNYSPCDVTKTEEINTYVKSVFDKEKRIDILINCAGMGISGAVEHTMDEDIEKIFKVNVYGTMNMCRAVIPYMRLNNYGRIVNIGSVAGVLAIPFQSYYSATKAAIENFSIALDGEIKNFGIRVTTVLPGDTRTGFTDARRKNHIMVDDNYHKRIEKSINQMEKDEQTGMSPVSVSKVIYKAVVKHNPPRTVTVGFKYKMFVGLNKFLPKKLVSFIVGNIYAK